MKFWKQTLFSLSAIVAFSCQTKQESWHQAAGPNNNFTVQSPSSAPSSWSVETGKNILWKMALPEAGQGGICVVEDKIFLTTYKEIKKIENRKKDLSIRDILALCLDRKTGQILWQHELKGFVDSPACYGFSDATAASPVSDGESIFFYNATGRVTCFDFYGNEKWTHTWMPVYELDGVHFPFNKQFEPMIHGDLIFNLEPALATSEGRVKGWNYIVAIDKKTGETRWVSKDALTHYNTPIMGTLNDGRQALLIGRNGPHKVPERPEGYSMIDLANGETIWRYDCTYGHPLHNSMWNEKYAVWMTEHDEIHILDSQTGKLIKKISLKKKVDLHSFNQKTGKYEAQLGVEYAKGLKKHDLQVFPMRYTNIIVGNHLFFQCSDKSANKKGRGGRGPKHSFARVNLETDRVEYLEVPVQVLHEKEGDKYLWGQRLFTGFRNRHGLDIAQDGRAHHDGWDHNFNGNSIAVNNKAYFTIMMGHTYCLQTDTENFDASAFLGINDLGPRGKTWSLNTPSFADGVLYHRTHKELIAIKEK